MTVGEPVADGAVSTRRRRLTPLTRLALRRLATVPVVLLGIVTVVFFAMRMIPGSPATSLGVAGTDGLTSDEIQQNIDSVSASLGLDQPLWQQYLRYLGAVARLDLGYSFFGGASVRSLLGGSLPATIELTVTAMLLAIMLGVTTGVLAAVRHGRFTDRVILLVSTVTFSLPWFALGVIGIVVFSVQLGWLPVLGRLPNSLDYEPTTNFVLLDSVLQGRPELILPWLKHLILPAVSLGLSMTGFITRMVRASMLEKLGEDFVRTAKMKGVGSRRVLSHHVMRNSALPIVTVLGLQFGALLGGSVITETVFSYPGVGHVLVRAVNQRDYLLVQGAVFATAGLFILINVIVDLLYLILDPRLRRT